MKNNNPVSVCQTGFIAELNPKPGDLVRVVSDLHLGHERSRFSGVEEWRNHVRGCKHLIVAGDLAETRVCEFQEQAFALRERFCAMCREEEVELHVVAGNHDPTEPIQMMRLWNGRVVVLHGHTLFKTVAPWGWEYIRNKEKCRSLILSHPQCDTDLQDRLALARDMSLLSPPVLRQGHPARTSLGRFLLHCAWPPSRPLAIIMAWLTMGWRMQRFAEHFFPEAQIVCFGHFHRCGEWTKGGRRYLNTGAHFKNASASAIDLLDGQVIATRKIPLLQPSAGKQPDY